jgi:succinate dehydrogenase / fumarate reductase cytochrome b subunit
MRWTGVFLLLFIIYHVLDLTLGALHPTIIASYREGDVYSNLLGDFRVWYIALIYIAAMLALGLHVYHGVWSMAQTLGLTSVRSDRAWRAVAAASAVVLSIGNIAIPVSMLIGLVR